MMNRHGVQPPEPENQSADPRAEIRRLIALSEETQDDPIRSLEICQRAVILAEQAGPDFALELGDSLCQRGILASRLSNYDAALNDYTQAYQIYEAQGDQKGIAILQNESGVIYAAVGLFPEALQAFLVAHEFFRGDVESIWWVRLLNNVGFSYLLLNDPGAGLPYLEEGLRILKASGDVKTLSPTLDSLAHAVWQLGDLERARQYSLEAAEAARQNSSNFDLSESQCTIGQIYLAMGQTDQAQAQLLEAWNLAVQSGYRRIEAESLFALGETYTQSAQLDLALDAIQRSLSIAKDTGLRPLIYKCFRALGEICKRKRDFEGALGFLEQLIGVSEDISRYQARLRLQIQVVAREMERTRRESARVREKNMALEQEVEKRKQAQHLAEHLAITDSLTGLFNRRHFFELARQELVRAERYQHPLTLIMLDIDHFKQVNDTFGHITGDDVLVMGTGLIRASLREGDVVGRYGGEEFVILLPNTEPEQARLAAERLRASIASQNLDTDKGPVSVTISIGIASIDHTKDAPAPNLDQLLLWADEALYNAKRAGRNRIAVYQGNHS